MLNQPYMQGDELDDVIDNNINNLLLKLQKMGYAIDKEDIQYSFIGRVENLYIDSGKIYENEDLPNKFGVQRGYAGGGMHSGLGQTDISRIKKSRQAKATRALELFKDTFWQVLKDIDDVSKLNLEEQGETLESWDEVSI